MLDIKRKMKKLKSRIIRWWTRVPFEIHEEALKTIITMEDTIRQLEKRNSLLDRKNRLLEKELEYSKKRDKIHQDINLEILPYIDLPAKARAEVKRLNKKLDKLIISR